MIHPATGLRSGTDGKAGRFDADGVVPHVNEVRA